LQNSLEVFDKSVKGRAVGKIELKGRRFMAGIFDLLHNLFGVCLLAVEGSLRTAGMIRWPGKIRPQVSNEMFSQMDFFPTLAKFAGAKIPTDRPIDGIDQSAYLLGQNEKGSRESMLTFIGDQLVAVRWHQWRYYMVDVQPAGAHKIDATGLISDLPPTAGYPLVYNIELDPREENPYLLATSQFVLGPMIRVIAEYQKTLVGHPNPPAPNLTNWQMGPKAKENEDIQSLE
jgi:C-terminal region of aryl-sulfatase/Sulfatase